MPLHFEVKTDIFVLLDRLEVIFHRVVSSKILRIGNQFNHMNYISNGQSMQ